MRYTETRLLRARIEELESANMRHQQEMRLAPWQTVAAAATAFAGVFAAGAAVGAFFLAYFTHH
jgi:hypothetical protein